MSWLRSFFMSDDPEVENQDLVQGQQYEEVLNTLANKVPPEDIVRALQLIKMRPDASPGVITSAVLSRADDETFNYMANVDTGEDESAWMEAVETVTDKIDSFTGNGLWEYLAKPVVRGAYTAFEALSEELVQRPLTSGLAALSDPDSTVGSRTFGDQITGGNIGERYLDAYRQYGDSPGRVAVERIAQEGPGVLFEKDDEETEEDESFLGTGFLPGGTAGKDRRQLTIQGERANIGRLFATSQLQAFDVGPGDAAYDWYAGIMQFGIEVGTDPANLLSGGTAGLARKGAALTTRGLAAKGGDLVTEAARSHSAARRFLRPQLSEEGMRRVNNNRLLTWLDERDGFARRRNTFSSREQAEALGLARRAADEMGEVGDEVSEGLAGEMMGFIENRMGRTIDPEAAEGIFRRSDDLIKQLQEADTLDLMVAFGQSRARTINPKALRELGRENLTRDQVLTILLDQIGNGYVKERKIYSGLGRTVRKVIDDTWAERYMGIGPSGVVDYNNVAESAAKLDSLARQARLSREQRLDIMNKVLEVDEGDAAHMASVVSETLSTVAKQIAEDTGVDIGDSGEFLRMLTKSREQIYQQLDNYNVANVASGVGDSPFNRTLKVYAPDGRNFEYMTISGAHLASELQKFRMVLPRSEEIRRAAIRTEKYRHLMQSPLWKGFSSASRFVTTAIFKPTALLRPAYIVRTQVDDQARMAAAGFSSLGKNPVEFIQMLSQNAAKGDDMLLDLVGSRLVDARQARNIISGLIVDSAQDGVKTNLTRYFEPYRKPANLDEVTDDAVNGWRNMLGQIRNEPIANMMVSTGWTPRQMFIHIRGKQGLPTDAVRFMERDMVSDALAAKFRSDDLFTVLDDEGEEIAGRLQRMIDDEDSPFDGTDIAPVVDSLLDEVAEELQMPRDYIESLFDEFEEDISTRLSKEWADYLDDVGTGRTAPEFGMLANLTRGGARWGDVKRTRGAARVASDGTVKTATDAGTTLQRGVRIPLSKIATQKKGHWVPKEGVRRGDLVDLFKDRRLTRASDDPKVADRFALTDVDEDYVEVVYKFDDDTKVLNMAWTGAPDADVMLARDQTFRVKTGAANRLKRNDEGVYRLEVELQSVPDTTVLGSMAAGKTPEWFYDLYDPKVWDGSVEGLRERLDEYLDPAYIAKEMERSTEAHLARTRIEDPNKITESELDEWITNQRPDLIARERQKEMESVLDEMEAYQNDGVLDPDGSLAAMVQRAPVIKDDLYLVAEDLDFEDAITSVKGFNASELKGSTVSSRGRVVRAYRKRSDLPEGSTAIRVRGSQGVQAMRVGAGQYLLPDTTLRFRRAYSDGMDGVRVETEIVSQPSRSVTSPDKGDSDVVRSLRNLARNGDLKAQQVLLHDDALMEYLQTVHRRWQYDTGGNSEIRDLMTKGGADGLPDFDDPSQNAKINAFLRERLESMPPVVKVERRTKPISSYDAKGALQRFIDTQYENIISKPANKLSRLPTWQQAMIADLERQMPAMANDAIRRQVYDNAVENLTMTPTQQRSLLKAMDDAKGMEGVLDDLDEINDLMLTHATETVEKTLFDVSTRSAFQEAFDAWVPFVDAWREGMEIWARLIKNDPSLVAKGFSRYRSAMNTGVIRTNERGERVFTVPGSSALGNWVEARARASERPGAVGGVGSAITGAAVGAAAGSRLGPMGTFAGAGLGAAVGGDPRAALEAARETVTTGFGGEEEDTVDLQFESRVTGANLVLQSVGPGFGPVVQWAAGAFLPDNPELNGLKEFINPYGTQPPTTPGELVDTLVPPYMHKVFNAYAGGEPDDVQWNGAVADTMDALAMKRVPKIGEDGQIELDEAGDVVYEYAYDPSNPVDHQRLVDDAMRGARALLLVRGYVQGVSITGASGKWSVVADASVDEEYTPGRQWDPEKDPDGVFYELSTLADEYYNLLDETNDPGEATARFLEEFGVTPAYLATPRSKAQSPLPTDVEGQAWVQKNPKLFTNYPLVAGYFSPLNEGDDFDYSVWRNQFAKKGPDGRVLVTPEQRMALAHQAQARQRYFKVKDSVKILPQKMQRAVLGPVKAQLDIQFPGWDGAVAGVADAPTADKIAQLERIIEDPALEGNPLLEPLQGYMRLRSQMQVVARAQSGDPTATLGRKEAAGLRVVLASRGKALAQESPEFARVWRILSREVEE